jgi:hypothetical protein
VRSAFAGFWRGFRDNVNEVRAQSPLLPSPLAVRGGASPPPAVRPQRQIGFGRDAVWLMLCGVMPQLGFVLVALFAVLSLAKGAADYCRGLRGNVNEAGALNLDEIIKATEKSDGADGGDSREALSAALKTPRGGGALPPRFLRPFPRPSTQYVRHLAPPSSAPANHAHAGTS